MPAGSRLPDLTTKTPHTEGRLEAVSLYKGNQHYGSRSMQLRLTLARRTTSGAEVWLWGWGVTAREEHRTGLGTGEHTSRELPKGTRSHTNTA